MITRHRLSLVLATLVALLATLAATWIPEAPRSADDGARPSLARTVTDAFPAAEASFALRRPATGG